MAETAPVRPIVATGTNAASVTGGAVALSVQLRRERGGAVIAEERVSSRDLVDALSEWWFETRLREGSALLGLSDVRARLRPVFREDAETGRYCAGFDLENVDEQGAGQARYFPRDCLEHVAARGARRLLQDGSLERGEVYYYGLSPGAESPRGEARDDFVSGPPGRGAPGFLRRRLPPLLDRARSVGGVSRPGRGDPYPVFFTQQALERAERASRAGAAETPPVETGGLFFGPLCLCPETGEIYAVVVDVIDARGSEASTYSLTYAGSTWARIQTIVRARTSRKETRHHRILGQHHGHNFEVYEGVPPCAECHQRAVCTRSSAYLSEDDRLWCRAVFPGEPWQLSQVFGLDARHEGVEAFYGQRHGVLTRRGYHVIEGFEAEEDD